jgi:HAD superfamily hydrolase (TIGR01450 family)
VALSALRTGDAFVFDVDGTLVLSEDPNRGGGVRALSGAAAVLGLLRARGKRFVCFTNGTGQVPEELAARLRGAGLEVDDSQVLTPASVAAAHIRFAYPDERVLAFGTSGVLEPLQAAGVRTVGLAEAEDARVVLIGADPDFDYEKLTAACRAVWAGAVLLVTSMAPYFVSSGGRLPSTSGAIAAGIRHVTGAEPVVVGKPSPLVLEMSARTLGARPAELVVVGDDLRLEIKMARAAGAASVLVLTGSSTAEQLAEVAETERPDLVLPQIGVLLEYL